MLTRKDLEEHYERFKNAYRVTRLGIFDTKKDWLDYLKQFNGNDVMDYYSIKEDKLNADK